LDRVIERRPFDQFHRVVMQSIALARSVDGDNVGVMQLGRCGRFTSKPRDSLRSELKSAAQDFECDGPVERDLPRLIDDAHAAPANLADNLEIAESLDRRPGLVRFYSFSSTTTRHE